MRDFKATRAPDPASRWLRLRLKLLGGLFLAVLAVALGRAVKLQVFDQQRLRELAEDQYVRQIDIPARRGDIFDRRGIPLAQSVEVDSLWVDPSLLTDVRQAAQLLARALGLDSAELQARLSRARRFAWVKRRLKPEEVEAVKQLGLPGLGFTREPKRFYPQRELGAHLVGLVGNDGRGLEGLELSFNDELSGQSAQVTGFRDARGRKLLTTGGLGAVERQGASVTLTLDRQLQHFAERALEKAIAFARARAGTILVLDPRSGEILALANHPRFNPNTPEKSTPEATRNRAVTDAFEPGSTFKAFMLAAAYEEAVVKHDELFFCENGAWEVGRHTINDTQPHGWLTPPRMMMVSSNICAAKIAQRLGRERLTDYYARFGFGERTGIGLSGEGKGSVPFPKAEVALATQSFGQGLSVTALQLGAGFGALANGGVLMRPYLVQKVVDPDGVVLLENKPTEVRRVVSRKAAERVLRAMELVVTREGTAQKAAMDEYRVAGKTGTAQKADPVARGYSDKRIASFAGVVPADDPRLVILVVIDEPKTDVYGGVVAAPAFREVAAAALPYLGVAPRERPFEAPAVQVATAARSVALARGGTAVARPVARTGEEGAAFVSATVGRGIVVVPDLEGKVGRDAVSALLAVALEPRLVGSGRVATQSPAAGTRVVRGTKVTVELAARR